MLVEILSKPTDRHPDLFEEELRVFDRGQVDRQGAARGSSVSRSPGGALRGELSRVARGRDRVT